MYFLFVARTAKNKYDVKFVLYVIRLGESLYRYSTLFDVSLHCFINLANSFSVNYIMPLNFKFICRFFFWLTNCLSIWDVFIINCTYVHIFDWFTVLILGHLSFVIKYCNTCSSHFYKTRLQTNTWNNRILRNSRSWIYWVLLTYGANSIFAINTLKLVSLPFFRAIVLLTKPHAAVYMNCVLY